MRIIPKDHLPDNFQDTTIIKKSTRNRCIKMHSILEKTLSRCNEMYSEYQSHTVQLRDRCQKEGFSLGFEIFFSQLLQFIDQYTSLQEARIKNLQESMHQSIKSSFDDTVIIERILHHLQEKCGQLKPLRVILPHTVKLDAHIDASNFTFSTEENITVQTDLDSIRFPISSIYQKWLDESIQSVDLQSEYLQELLPHLLLSMQRRISLLLDNHNE